MVASSARPTGFTVLAVPTSGVHVAPPSALFQTPAARAAPAGTVANRVRGVVGATASAVTVAVSPVVAQVLAPSWLRYSPVSVAAHTVFSSAGSTANWKTWLQGPRVLFVQ